MLGLIQTLNDFIRSRSAQWQSVQGKGVFQGYSATLEYYKSNWCNFLWIQRILISLACNVFDWMSRSGTLWFSSLVSHLPAWLHSTYLVPGTYDLMYLTQWGAVALWFSVLVNNSDYYQRFSCFFQSSAVQISHLLLLQATSVYLPKMTTHAPDDCKHGTDWCQALND